MINLLKIERILIVCSLFSYCYAVDDMNISDESLKNINHEKFCSPRLKVKQSPSMFAHSQFFTKGNEIAFEETSKKDIYEITEDLTFSYLKDSSQDVAEEDFILKDNKIKQVEKKETSIKFSRTPL